MYFNAVKIGAFTAAERAKVYQYLNAKYPVDSTIFPNLEGWRKLYDQHGFHQRKPGICPIKEILIDGTPIATIEYKWALQHHTNNTGGNNIEYSPKFLPGATNDTLYRNDYMGPDHFGHGNGPPTGRKIVPHFRVTDIKGRRSPWIEGAKS